MMVMDDAYFMFIVQLPDVVVVSAINRKPSLFGSSTRCLLSASQS